MSVVSMKQLLKEQACTSVTRPEDGTPKMAQYIFTERNGILSIIDLQKTRQKLEEAYMFVP